MTASNVHRRYTREHGASTLEYVAVLTLVAAVAGIVVLTMSNSGGTIVAGVERAVCAITGGDCDVDGPGGTDETFLWEGVGDESDWERPIGEDGSEVLDLDAVENALEQLEEYLDPDCSWWEFWCSGPNPALVFDDLLELTPEELDAVFSQLSDEEIRELLEGHATTAQRGRIWQLWQNFSPERREQLREILGDDMFGEPAWGDLPGEREYEYRPMTEGSLWGPDGEPQLSDIEQGSISDCWWMASMGAIAHTHPEIIQDMISENPDGTYTVTFPDGDTVTVTPDFPYNTTDDNWAFARPTGADPAIWPMVMEKAFAERSGGYDNIENWFAGPGMETITGGDSTNYLNDERIELAGRPGEVIYENNRQNIQQAMEQGQEDGQPMVAATYHRHAQTDAANAVYDEHGLSNNHQYVVDRVNDDGSVVVRDPYTTHRSYTLEADDFHAAFPLVHIHDVG